ncbi:ATP-binding protein [Enterococcus ureasiticus]|uniref:VirB4-like conjugal transfer ATPase, CD1110 family n=1 Tax=Enterococcus ureasiticus TaxID=903984 RepID=UPI001A8F2C45|nr:DUF87 domain-containing protein [Enterococcus ureasiticus]MBO0474622.1 ATP-binding protein [Enterococcus ureasiticus]
MKLKRLNKKEKNVMSKKKNKYSIGNCIQYEKMYKNGLCKLLNNSYSISVEVKDINYQLSSNEFQLGVFTKYCDFLNSLGEKTDVQLTLQKSKRSMSEVEEMVFYPSREDNFQSYRDEMNQIVAGKIAEERNGFRKRIIFTFTQKYEKLEHAQKELDALAERFDTYIRKIGSESHILNGQERLQLFSNVFTKKKIEESDNIEENSKDMFLPDQIEFKDHKKHIKIGDKYSRILYMAGYPAELSDTFLSELIEIPKELTISLFIKPLDQAEAFDLVRTKLAFMEQQKVDEQKTALKNGYDFEMLPYDLSYSLSEAKELLDDLQNKGQKLFSITATTHISGDSKKQLDEIDEDISAVARRFGFKFLVFDYIQEQCLNSVLPLGINLIPSSRTLTTASTAIFMPFTIPELIQNNGKYYGVNSITKNIISIDRKNLKAPNGFVLGTPGSGKSFSVKREIVNVILRDTEDEIIIIDPEREYSILAENFEGEIVKISGDSKSHINPMDISDNYGDDIDPVVLKSEFLLSLFDLIVGGSLGLSSAQKTIIDRSCRRAYEIAGIEGDRTLTLIDFFNVLKEQKEEEAQQLVIDLEIYIEGSLSVFSHETNVDINKRLVVYDIKDLGQQLKTMGMLVVLDQVWHRITKNRLEGVRTWLYIDEMQLLFTNEYSATYFFELWSRARKWGAIPTGITQNVETLLLSDLARRMLSNSDFVMMLNQAKSDREQLVRLFDISEEQEKYMVNTDEGSGLMIFGETTLPFFDRFPKETQLYKMMSTKPGEAE